MKLSSRQSAFSLLEVLFALMVLTLGFIFVASQFPIALDNSRKIAETTANTINTHNDNALVDLDAAKIVNNWTSFFNYNFFSLPIPNIPIPAGPYYFINQNGLTSFYYQPNCRAAYFAQYISAPPYPNVPDLPRIIMDDPLNTYFMNFGFTASADFEYPWFADHTITIFQNGQVPSSLQVRPVTAATAYVDAVNIGDRVCPPVTSYDKAVLQIMREKYGMFPPFFTPPAVLTDVNWKKWQKAILDVAVNQRNICTVTLYRCTNPVSFGGDGRSFRMYIFNCRFDAKTQRFPVQRVVSTSLPLDYYNPRPYDGATAVLEDRIFPVPWYIALNNAIVPTVRGLPPYNKSLEIINLTDSNDNSANIYSDYAPAIINLLRVGSWIVNAVSGESYQIKEISGMAVRLSPPIQLTDGNLWHFWVIPPAIDRNKASFVDNQPVLSMVEKTVRF
jgi:hypothetical protein